MPSVFWTGRLSPLVKSMVNFSNALAWVTGNARDATAMKDRMKKGYDGLATDDVTRYDEIGLEHYRALSKALLEETGLEETGLEGKTVLDVGCGTGILSFLALEHGAAKIVCGDLSEYMLAQCEKKAKASSWTPDQIVLRQLDGESLPFENASFDAVISGMALGLMPNQKKAVSEMVRVLKVGGNLAVSTHGPDLYFEACETTFMAMPKSTVLCYRVEFWPRKERQVALMLSEAGLIDVHTRRLTWKERFEDGGEAYDFFVATSSGWWYSKFPVERVAELSRIVKERFIRKNIREITTDVILAHGRKI